MIRIFYFVALLLLSALTSVIYGQGLPDGKITISGKIETQKQNAATDTLLYLINAPDGKLIKTETCDQNGNFTFEEIPAGEYLLKISASGKTVYTGNPFKAYASLALDPVSINPEINNLAETVITRKKPYLELREGKMILNVENNIGNTGSSAFEVLEKAPGVKVDNNDNISLRGKTGIQVQIDGKPTPMSGSNLANYLRGIPSGSVEKIEFITNPSSKYDASGSAIINIRMKKDRKMGTNGSISTAYGQGIYPKSNSGVSLNHRNKKTNAFGSYSFAYREGMNQLQLERRFYENGQFTGAYDQDNFLKMNFRNHIGRFGLDYFMDGKNTFGIVVNGISNKFNPTGRNVSDVYDQNQVLASRFETRNNSRDYWHNDSVNLNHKFVADTLGTELTTDFDYANFGNETGQKFHTDYTDLDANPIQDPYLLKGDLRGNLNIYALKSDFVTFLKNKTKFETGVKASYVKADNNLAFYDMSSGMPVFDDTKSNHFIYTENINAAYVNASKEIGKKWGVTLGLRIENTNITGKQLVDGTSFKNDYTQLFPSALVSYAVNAKNSFELNYSRRISRPGYDQLNPFKFFLDPTTYREGNPYLRPQTTHSLDFTHIYDQRIFTTLSFSRTMDNITEVIAPSDGDQQLTVQTNKNLDTADIYGLFIVLPFELAKWWSVNNSVNLYYGSYSGTVANTTLQNQGNFTWNINSAHSFKIGKGYSAELTGDYRAREVYAFMDVDPICFLNIGFQKKFRNNSTLKLAVNDVFFSNYTTADTEFTGYKERFDVRRDTRTAVLSYIYNFGNGNSPQRKRAGGAEDIKQRAGSSNG